MGLMSEYYLLFWLNLFVLGLGFLSSFRKRRVYSFMWGALLLFHILSAFKEQALVEQFSQEALVFGQELMLVANSLFFAVLFLMDSLILRGRSVTQTDLKDPAFRRPVKRYFHIMVVLIAVAIVIRFRHGLGVLYTDWEAERAALFSALDTLSNQLGFLFYPAIWIAFRCRKYMLAIILAALGIVFFQFSGSRAMLLTVACVVYIDLLRMRVGMPVRLLLLALLGAISMAMHTVARAIRGLGLAVFLAAVLAGALMVRLSQYYEQVKLDVSGGESDIYEYYYYVVEKDYMHPLYRTWPTLRRLALLYVPRSLAPALKPEDITYQIWRDNLSDGYMNASPFIHLLREMARTEQDGCLPPTIWGDAFANGGLTGIFLYPVLFGIMAVTLELALVRLSVFGLYAIAPIVGAGYLMIARGAIIVGSGHIGYVVPIAALVFVLGRLPLWLPGHGRRPVPAAHALPGSRRCPAKVGAIGMTHCRGAAE